MERSADAPLPRSEHWQCITGCGSCCRLDPALRGDAIAALDPHQQERYLEMVGPDGWCIHFDTGSRRCRIYEDRPDFCRVEHLVSLFGQPGEDPEALAIASCKQQIRAELGGRHRVMHRFLSTIRRQP
jgi:Fe-S-cluster containining protein